MGCLEVIEPEEVGGGVTGWCRGEINNPLESVVVKKSSLKLIYFDVRLRLSRSFSPSFSVRLGCM